jgi:LysR family glycine cleavage system transcriptional activator
MQAAIDGAGVVLGRLVPAEGDLAAGRLVRPFSTTLPLDVSYFLVRPKAAAPRRQIRVFSALAPWLAAAIDRQRRIARARVKPCLIDTEADALGVLPAAAAS